MVREIELDGVRVPAFFYGTAWKEDRTERLTAQAVELGFRAIDTANQRKHYFEAGVGAALRRAFERGSPRRSELFLQTKFTYQGGQDQRLPYDPEADYATQVRQSFESSLEHLGTDYVDSYVLHGPLRRRGLAGADREVWRAMAALRASGRVRLIGVSNVSLEQLTELVQSEDARPSFVQNRCYASTGWDAGVRSFCREHGIGYQAFSLLTANPSVLAEARVRAIARRIGATPAQLVFRFALEVGMFPLTGTSSPAHAAEDLAVFELPPLASEEIEILSRAGVPG